MVSKEKATAAMMVSITPVHFSHRHTANHTKYSVSCHTNGLRNTHRGILNSSVWPVTLVKAPFLNGTVHTYRGWRRDSKPVILKWTTIHKLAPDAETQQCDVGKLSKFQPHANVVWCAAAAASWKLRFDSHREQKHRFVVKNEIYLKENVLPSCYSAPVWRKVRQ